MINEIELFSNIETITTIFANLIVIVTAFLVIANQQKVQEFFFYKLRIKRIKEISFALTRGDIKLFISPDGDGTRVFGGHGMSWVISLEVDDKKDSIWRIMGFFKYGFKSGILEEKHIDKNPETLAKNYELSSLQAGRLLALLEKSKEELIKKIN